jgi:hypothetical protein
MLIHLFYEIYSIPSYNYYGKLGGKYPALMTNKEDSLHQQQYKKSEKKQCDFTLQTHQCLLPL